MQRPKTVICDIDGTIVEHMKPNEAANPNSEMKPLPGSIDKLMEWEKKGYNIILITGRKESTRHATTIQLANAGIFYDQLIMGVGGGQRILINDLKPDMSETAFSVNVERNKGISALNI